MAKIRKSTSTTNKKWGTNNNWEPETFPGVGDDVEFKGASPESDITEITATAKARSLDLKDFKKKLTHKASVTLEIGTTTNSVTETSASVFLALRLPTSGAGGKYEPEAGAELLFKSSSGSAQSIFTNGQTLTATTFKGAGGKWQLEEATTMGSNTVTLEAGELKLNGFKLTCGKWNSPGSTARSLVGGTGTLTLTGTGKVWNEANENTVYSLTSATVEVTDTTTAKKEIESNTSSPSASFGTLKITGDYVFLAGNHTITTLEVTGRAPSTFQGTVAAGKLKELIATSVEGTALAAGMEIEGSHIPTGTTLVKEVAAGVWEISKEATESFGVAVAMSAYRAGFLGASNNTQTITTLIANSGSGTPVRLASNSDTEATKIKFPVSKYVFENVRFRNIKLEGTTEFYAPLSKGCVDCLGNSGIKFEDPPGHIAMML